MKLNDLQAVRAIAASMVVLNHGLERAHVHGPLIWLAKASGLIGVWIFFVVSGFIMVHTTGRKFGKPRVAGRFAQHRIIRIVPLYWLFTLAQIALMVLLHQEFGPREIIGSFAFIPYLNEAGKPRPLLGQGWTLDYEMLFYAVFAISLLMRRRLGLWFSFGSLALLASLHYVVRPSSTGFSPATWCDPIVLLFGAGMALGLIRERLSISARPWSFAAASCLPLAAVVAVLGTPFTAAAPVISAGFCVLAVAAVVLSQDSGSRIAGFFARFGDSSYSTYLIHPFVLLGLSWPLHHLPWIVSVPAALVICNLAGVVSLRMVERPITAFLKGLTERRTATSKPVIAANPAS